jgi:hypothetical protein
MNHQQSPFQQGEIGRQRLWRRCVRAVLGDKDEDCQGQDQRDCRQADDVLPTERNGQHRREQRRQDGARVARTSNAQGCALMLGRIPCRSQRQRHRERCACKAEHASKQQRGGKAVDADGPGDEQPGDHDDLGADADSLRLEAINQKTQHDTKRGPREDRCCNHQALLARIEVQLVRDSHAKGAENHPNHEAEVEVQKGCEQGRQMAGLHKAIVHGRFIRRAGRPWPTDRLCEAGSLRLQSAPFIGQPRELSKSPARSQQNLCQAHRCYVP